MRMVSPTETLLQRGDRVSGAYFVLEGQLRVFSISVDGSEATLYAVSAGEACILALNCLFNDLLYPAWVQADTRSRVAVVPGPIFRRLFQSEPVLQDVTVRALSTIVFRLMNELDQVHALKLDQRLANLLLLRASSRGALHMTHQQMADHLGTTREVVGRLLRSFVARRLITLRRGATTVVDSPGLTRVALRTLRGSSDYAQQRLAADAPQAARR